MIFRNRKDVEAELVAHLEHEEAELRAAGMSPDEAHRVARLKLGNVALTEERVHDGRAWRWLESLWQDIRYGARLLRRNPAFSVTAALVLSLGIGVNTALFSIVDRLFVPVLPVPAPEELFYMGVEQGNGRFMGNLRREAMDFFEENASELASFTRHLVWGGTISTENRAEPIYREVVDSRYFEVVRVGMALGRAFRPEDDDVANPELSIVVSHRLWTKLFDADPHVIGRRVRLEGRQFAVIGVAQDGFRGLSELGRPVDCWVTGAQTGEMSLSQPVGRLRAGVRFTQLEALVAAKTPLYQQQAWERLPADARARQPDFLHRRPFKVFRATDVPIPAAPGAQLVPFSVMVAMISVAALVLIIAIANVSGLLLARGVSRSSEMAMRRALGASTSRVFRQALTETALLALLGGGLGGGIAVVLVRAFGASTPSRLSIDVAVDWRLWAFAAVVSIATGVVTGASPALQAIRLNVLGALGGGGSHSTGRAATKISRLILIPQVACSIALLAVAAVHMRTLARVELTPGYRTDNVLVMGVGLLATVPALSFAERRQIPAEEQRKRQDVRLNRWVHYKQALLNRVVTMPAVLSLGLVSDLPLPGGATPVRPQVLLREDYDAGRQAQVNAPHVVVTGGYFDALGIHVLRGRTFNNQDAETRARVTILSEGLAREVAANGDVVGKSVAFISDQRNDRIDWYEVVGVVNDVEKVSVAEMSAIRYGQRPRRDSGIGSIAYLSLAQDWKMRSDYLVIRGRHGIMPGADELRAAAHDIDPFADVSNVRPLGELVAEANYPRRVAALVLTAAGLVGLLLAVIGLYAAVSYAAIQRLREIGIRAALGATRRDLMGLLLGEGTKVVALGSVAGLGLAIAALRLTAWMYPDLPKVDLVSFIGVPLLLLAVVLTACVIPARRAARTDPAKVLRGE